MTPFFLRLRQLSAPALVLGSLLGCSRKVDVPPAVPATGTVQATLSPGGAAGTESIEALARRLSDQAIGEYESREGEIYQLVIDRMEGALIERALAKCGGVKTKAADFLGINRNTLNKKVKDLGIEAAE